MVLSGAPVKLGPRVIGFIVNSYEGSPPNMKKAPVAHSTT